MERLQFGLFYEEFSLAALCKVVSLINKTSHRSVIIALFYLFLVLFFAIRPISYLQQLRDHSSLKPFISYSIMDQWAKLRAQMSSAWIPEAYSWKWVNVWIFVDIFIKKKPLAPLLACLWAGLQHKLQHFFLLCCVWQIRIYKPVQHHGLLHASEAVVSKAIWQSLCCVKTCWAYVLYIYMYDIHMHSVYCSESAWKPQQKKSDVVPMLWPMLWKEYLGLSMLFNFFKSVCISAKLQSQKISSITMSIDNNGCLFLEKQCGLHLVWNY